MKILADLHTHTVASGHAYSSLQEMVAAAAAKGIEVLGVTEHGPSIPGTCQEIYFKNMIVIPREIQGVKLLMGAELNILDTNGTIDATDRLWGMLDICIAGIHGVCWQGGTKDENTRGMIAAINNQHVHIISHPGDGTAELDFAAITESARDAHTLLEINSHSLHPARDKVMARANNLELLRLHKSMSLPVILGSDAHISYQVADYGNLLPLLREVDFPERLILNTRPRALFDYIGLSHLPQLASYYR